ARGVALDRIAFIPSHAGSPGPQASASHLQLWDTAQRSVGTLGDDLPHLLRQWAEPLLGGVKGPLEDKSAGRWRRHLYSHEDAWPAAMPMWERPKFLADTRGGRVLLKFAGVGAIGQAKLQMARALHAAALTPDPLGLVHGFLAERWCEDAQPLAA